MKIIVTGAGGVLGQAVCAAFAAAGAKLACIARDERSAVEDRLAWFACPDLADERAASDAVARAYGWLGGLDGVVHVAGAFDWKRVQDSGLDDWRDLYDVIHAGYLNFLTDDCGMPHRRPIISVAAIEPFQRQSHVIPVAGQPPI